MPDLKAQMEEDPTKLLFKLLTDLTDYYVEQDSKWKIDVDTIQGLKDRGITDEEARVMFITIIHDKIDEIYKEKKK